MKRTLIATVKSVFLTSDEEAMLRVQAEGDAHAFAGLMHRWERPIQRLCLRMLRDSHRAEDLTQETFARLFARRREYQPTAKFSTFLWRVALNLCYDELRRLKRRPESALDEVLLESGGSLAESGAFDAGPAAHLLEREQGEQVREAVLALPEGYRSVVILRHYENLKFREIAEVMGIPEGTVKSRMAEALTQLHRTLTRALGERNSTLCRTEKNRCESSLVL